MTIQVDFWQLLLALAGVIASFAGLAKILLAQTQRNIEGHITTLKHESADQTARLQRLERELLELKAELPRDYVRREDYTQAIATIMTKLDAMALRFENILLRDKQHHER